MVLFVSHADTFNKRVAETSNKSMLYTEELTLKQGQTVSFIIRLQNCEKKYLILFIVIEI